MSRSLRFLLSALFLSSGILAQAPVAGDDFIVFAEGANTLVERVDPDIVEDPMDATNRVARFNFGHFQRPGFDFPDAVGINLADNQVDGDTLFMRILSDPANANRDTTVRLLLYDRDGGTLNDLGFRLVWVLPEDLSDGEWHDLAIPLPPARIADLEATREDPRFGWSYIGATGPNGLLVLKPDHALWKEFQWHAVRSIGFQWNFSDANGAGGPIYVDDLYIGGSSADLTPAKTVPPAISDITVTAADGANIITWADQEGIDLRRIYVSESPITDVTADGVAFLGLVNATDEDQSFTHTVLAPHPALGFESQLYYAVTSGTVYGLNNEDLGTSRGSVVNTFESEAFIVGLMDDEVNTILGSLEAGTPSPEGFPVEEMLPFRINSERFTETGGGGPVDDSDASAAIWMGHYNVDDVGSGFLMYMEMTDNQYNFADASGNVNGFWQFDSIEMDLGTYDVPFPDGSSHTEMEGGAEPDYQFRLNPATDGSVVTAVTRGGFAAPRVMTASKTVLGQLTDSTDAVIGFTMLTNLLFNDFPFEGEAAFVPPANSGIRLIPITFAFNDADESTRSNQLNWSIKPNVDGDWFRTPEQWGVAAVAGRGVQVSSEAPPESPDFSLGQNFPNPAAAETTIPFSVSQRSTVTLTTFNALGQVVGNPIDERLVLPGNHVITIDTSGLPSGPYFYRLEVAGSHSSVRSMTLIK